MSAPESNYRAWLRKADHDLLNIENNLAAERVPWDTVCYHAQQAAEKTLKAFLVYHGEMPPRTHDLVALLSRCVPLAPDLADLEADSRNPSRLMPSGLGTRMTSSNRPRRTGAR